MIRRETLAAVGGFDARYAPAADIQLWLKLLARGDLAWNDEKLCFIRMHDSHSHSYGPDPSESPFRVWNDATQIPNSPATAEIVARGLQREAERVYLYVASHLLGLRLARARTLFRLPAGYVGRQSSLLRWLATAPRVAVDQFRRIQALRSGHLVVYDPRPREGGLVENAQIELPKLSEHP